MSSNSIASKTKRFTNWLVDTICISILWFILMPLILMIIMKFGLFEHLKDGGNMDLGFTFFPVALLYYLVFEGIFKTTIGKLITRTKIIRLDNDKVSFLDVLLRTFSRFIPFEQLSFLMDSSVGWHDKISETRIINKN